MSVALSLQEAVAEVHNILTGLDLEYDDRYEIFHATVRQINRSLRQVALLEDWGWYSELVLSGVTHEGQTVIELDALYRPRINQGDCVQLVDPNTGLTWHWAYYLPRDSLSRHTHRSELRVAFVRNTLMFSRPIQRFESGYEILVPAMREPQQTTIPESGKQLSDAELNRPIDFEFPDLVVAHAAWQISLSNPVYQPRAQTLEAAYDDVRYALSERDSNHSDSPLRNDFTPSYGDPYLRVPHRHPHSDRR